MLFFAEIFTDFCRNFTECQKFWWTWCCKLQKSRILSENPEILQKHFAETQPLVSWFHPIRKRSFTYEPHPLSSGCHPGCHARERGMAPGGAPGGDWRWKSGWKHENQKPLVLGCIDSYDSESRGIFFSDFSRSTRFDQICNPLHRSRFKICS